MSSCDNELQGYDIFLKMADGFNLIGGIYEIIKSCGVALRACLVPGQSPCHADHCLVPSMRLTLPGNLTQLGNEILARAEEPNLLSCTSKVVSHIICFLRAISQQWTQPELEILKQQN
jgi:hypothetical protein